MLRLKRPSPFDITKISATLALGLKPAILTIAIIAFYYQDLALVLSDALTSEATSYILIIPLILSYLIYRKRKMLTAAITDTTSENQPEHTRYYSLLSGTLLCITAILVYWTGSYTFTPIEYHLFTLPIFTAGLTLILFNAQTLRQALFPIIFLIFLTPPPNEIFYNLGSALSVYSSEASTTLTRLIGIPATLTGEYGTPTILITRPDLSSMNFTVDVACSGIYSLTGFLVFATFIAYIARDKPWKKTTLFALGFPLIYFLNIIRITTIIAIGYNIGEQTALDVFHLLGGWVLIFIGTLLLLAISEKILKINLFTDKHKNICLDCTSPNTTNITRNYCTNCGRITKHKPLRFNLRDSAKMVAILSVMILLLWIQVPVFATTHSPAAVLIQTPDGETGNTQLFPNITGYNLGFEYRDTGFEKAAKQDYSVMFSYTPIDENKAMVWVGLEIASTTSSLHRWETCLVTWPQTQGYQVRVAELDRAQRPRDTQILDNPPIIARYFAFKYLQDNRTQLVLYWFETSIFTVNDTAQQKQVKISLITFPETPENLLNVENEILPIAEAIANYWQPTKTWSLVSMIISQNGMNLALGTTAFLIITVGIYFFQRTKQEKTRMDAYRKLATRDQQLVQTIRKVQQTTPSTVERIRDTYQKTANTELTTEQLEQKLTELSKIGLVKNTIGNSRDEPTRTWKA
jgi:exosortase